LLRYRHYGEGLPRSGTRQRHDGHGGLESELQAGLVQRRPARRSTRRSLTYLPALGDDVTKKTLKFYFAFRRIKNFACVEVHPPSQGFVGLCQGGSINHGSD
jgi:hypothetical protein